MLGRRSPTRETSRPGGRRRSTPRRAACDCLRDGRTSPLRRPSPPRSRLCTSGSTGRPSTHARAPSSEQPCSSAISACPASPPERCAPRCAAARPPSLLRPGPSRQASCALRPLQTVFACEAAVNKFVECVRPHAASPCRGLSAGSPRTRRCADFVRTANIEKIVPNSLPSVFVDKQGEPSP